jgi:hypothetical protein
MQLQHPWTLLRRRRGRESFTHFHRDGGEEEISFLIRSKPAAVEQQDGPRFQRRQAQRQPDETVYANEEQHRKSPPFEQDLLGTPND